MSAVWSDETRLSLARWELDHANAQRAQAAYSMSMLMFCIADDDWLHAGLWKDKVFGHLQCSDRHVAYADYLSETLPLGIMREAGGIKETK